MSREPQIDNDGNLSPKKLDTQIVQYWIRGLAKQNVLILKELREIKQSLKK